MANEISVLVSMECNNGGVQLYAPKQVNSTLNQAAAGKSCTVQTVGHAAHETLDIGDLAATLGYAMLRNLDATNFVDVGVQDGSSNFHPLIRLAPGSEPQLFRFSPAATPYAKADTAACKIEVDILSA
jgi:hypothetical protein